jgi:hypothetical protein
MSTNQAAIQELFKDFFGSNLEAIGLFLFDPDGTMIECSYIADPASSNAVIRGIADFDLERNEGLFAFNSALTLLLLDKNSRIFEPSASALEQVYMQTKETKILFTACGPEATLLVIYTAAMKSGLDLMEAKRLAQKLAKFIDARPKRNRLHEKVEEFERSLLTGISGPKPPPPEDLLSAKVFAMYPLPEFEAIQIDPILKQLIANNSGLKVHYYHQYATNPAGSSGYASPPDTLSYFLEQLEWCEVFVWIHTRSSKPIEYKLAQALNKRILILSTAIGELPSYARIKCVVGWKPGSALASVYDEIVSGLKNLIVESDGKQSDRTSVELP